MWVEKQKNGNYKFVERYEDALTGKLKKASLTATKNNRNVRKDMQSRLQEKIEELQKARSADIDFKELSKKWLIIFKKRVRASTFKRSSYQLNTVYETLGDIKLDKLTAATINQFLLDQFNEGLSFETVNSKKKIITQIVEFGSEFGFLADETLSKKIKIQRLNISEKKEWKYLERHELKKIIEWFEKNNMYEEARMCKIQVETGLRFNELVSIDYKKHVDFNKKKLLVERNYDNSNKRFTLPKNNKKRSIHLKDETLVLIQEQIKYDHLKMIGSNLKRNNTLLFRTKFDNPYPLKAMNKRLSRIKLESEKHLTTHIFRHTFITLMIEAGVDPKLIAEHVGHASTKMIDDVYSHFTDTMDSRLKQAVLNVKIV